MICERILAKPYSILLRNTACLLGSIMEVLDREKLFFKVKEPRS